MVASSGYIYIHTYMIYSASYSANTDPSVFEEYPLVVNLRLDLWPLARDDLTLALRR